MTRRWICFFCAMTVAATDAPAYRFHRSIEAEPGWCELEVPDDVLDAARPGLADVRVSLTPGGEIPYGQSGVLPPSTLKIPLADVERTPNQETTALADRGARPGWADAARLDVQEPEFIKPVIIEASADRATWMEIARGSIFATKSGTRMTTLAFAPNDRRYWRIHFDDKNSAPVRATYVAIGQSAEDRGRRPLPVTLKEQEDSALSVSTYAITLPSANLPVVEISIHAEDAAYVRSARVFERIWFRDEVSRRLLGQGQIARTADGRETASVPLTEPTSKSLELDIERSNGVPLHGVTAELALEPRRLRFYLPKDAVAELVYGSQAIGAPSYDITAALQQGRPTRFNPAKLGPVSDEGRQDRSVPEVARGAAVERAAWKIEQPIVLPPRGPIAYLDIERRDGSLDDIRIVDRAFRQVPYIVESEPRHRRLPLTFRTESRAGETILRLDGIDAERTIEAFELEASSPDFFARDMSVRERLADDRGETEPRFIGSARWVKAAGQPAVPFRVAVSPPAGRDVTIRFVDGDNAPLEVSKVTADVTRRRLNFVFEASDELRLLSAGNSALAPTYDLALIAERVLSSPAEPATLGPPHPLVVAPKKTPPWFWIFVFAAAIILLIAMARTLKQTL